MKLWDKELCWIQMCSVEMEVGNTHELRNEGSLGTSVPKMIEVDRGCRSGLEISHQAARGAWPA